MYGQRLNVVYDEEMSERDCLSLNIYMPASALNYEQELPVCVWIYGGGFTVGSITTPLYGKRDAKQHVIFSEGNGISSQEPFLTLVFFRCT